MRALQQNLFINAPTIAQHAALAAFDCDDELGKHVDRYRENRAILLEGLPRAGFTKLSSAGGAYYIYADVTHLTEVRGRTGYPLWELVKYFREITSGSHTYRLVGPGLYALAFVKPSPRVTVPLKDFGQRPINGASILVDRTRSKHTSQNRPSFYLRILLGHDSFIGKARLSLAERAKYRGSHGGAPETGFKRFDATLCL